MIKAVMFDYGGVLSEGGAKGSVRATLARALGISLGELKYTHDLHDQIKRGQISTEEFFAEVNKRQNSHLTPEQFLKSADFIAPSNSVYELASSLRKHGIRTGIFSDVYEVSANELRRLGRYDKFDPVLLSYQQGLGKPEPEFYQRILDKLSFSAHEILLIDDQEKYLTPATELGMHVILGKNSEQIVRDIKAILREQNNIELQQR